MVSSKSPSKYRRSMVVSSEQDRARKGVRAQAKESRSSTTRGPSGFLWLVMVAMG